jgi:hypothetical protein
VTTGRTLTPAQLRAHAHELARAFTVRLIETDIAPEAAFAAPIDRVAVVGRIVDDTTYAVALHELGHLLAPMGSLHTVAGNPGNLRRLEEDAAWAWARHYALDWTPAMEAVATWAEGTYAAPPPPKSIRWDEWK